MDPITWSEIIDAYYNEQILDVKVTHTTPSGATVNLGGKSAFIPMNRLCVPEDALDSLDGQTISAKIIKVAPINANILMYRHEKSALDDIDTESLSERELVKLCVEEEILKVGKEYDGRIINIGLNNIRIQLFEGIRGSLPRYLIPEDMLPRQYGTMKVTIVDIETINPTITLGLPGMDKNTLQEYAPKKLQSGSIVECVVSTIDCNCIKFTLPAHSTITSSHHKIANQHLMMYDFLQPGQHAWLIVDHMKLIQDSVRVFFKLNDAAFSKSQARKLMAIIGENIDVKVSVTDSDNVVIILFDRYVKLPATRFKTIPHAGDTVSMKILDFDEKSRRIEIEEA